MTSRAGIVSLSPDLELEEAKKRIEAERASQIAGMQSFGSDMDQRLQGIYGQLIGAQQQGVQTTQGIYGNAAQGVQQAYETGGQVAGAGAAQVQQSLANMAKMIGLDPAALKEVQGRLGEQAMRFGMAQQQGMTSRVGNIQQLGAGMAGVMQMGVQTAQQAMAQGRQDIAKKVATEIQRINTLAAQTQTGFIDVQSQQAKRAMMEAQREMLRAQAELEREQRSAARAAAAEARRSASSGPDWFTKFAMQNEEWERRQGITHPPEGPSAFDQILAEAADRFGENSNSLAYIVAGAAGADRDTLKEYKTPGGKKLNTKLLDTYVNRLRLTK